MPPVVHGLLGRGSAKAQKGRVQKGKSSEHNSLIAIKQHPTLYMPAYSAREDDLFQVPAFADEVFDGVAVRNPNNILLNDWPIVEHLGDVVTGGANQLHTALECLMVRPRADKCRKKRVLNVDNPLWKPVDKVVVKNMHLACQYLEIRLLY